MNKGNFTMPGEAGYEKLTLQLAKRWGADVIRDSEGTTLSEDILSSGYKIYSTICIIREHNEFAALHPETRAQTFLTTPFITAKGESLEIDLLDSFYKEQFEINETEKALSYLEVWDRSEDKKLAQSEYNYQKGKVTVKTVPFHLYSVSFLSYRIWEEISMYNHVTNSWTKEHLIPIDPRLPVAREYLLSYLDKWTKAHDNTSVVRFTSLFYNFVWIWGSDERNRNLFSDWASYDFSVSEKALEEFETTYGYSLTAEDFINKGKLQVTHMPPTKAKSDYMKLTNSFVAKLGREMVDIVHSYNKKAYVFYDDSWIGLEPYSPLFKTINFDGLIKCVFSGFEVRLCSGVEVPCHELRLHPYLFPVGLGGAPTFKEGGSPEKDARRYWISVRRALLHSKIERIGLGGYLHLVEKYPLFVDEIEKITKEFNQIKELTSAEKSVPILNKIAVLHTYGSLRSWTLSGHFHETFMHDLIHINEALSGFPAQVEFINFEEAKKDLSQYSVIINAGASLSAWSGSKAWDDIALVENLRRYVANGGVFIGV
ncbi:MAG: D-galactosyl-beta-1-4-L-rhamnose phosphorylase, partial [Spirochaetales bacterium]|nr:D-galactosyl-beta-1-4-L-rhamnose phosphorylase [Spirochaetales bacterium]